ncbi:MAG: SND2/TMEM208 family protein [Deltaproteobacteria bacterium]|nr:SND2/TMEM208 family protein [Deltaproteobacteria bacterium]
MTRLTKLVLGVFSFWPLAYAVIFFIQATIYVVTYYFNQNHHPYIEPPFSLMTMVVLHMITMVILAVLLLYYFFLAYTNVRLDNNKRMLWIGFLFFGNLIAMPIYYFIYVWPQPTYRPPGKLNG